MEVKITDDLIFRYFDQGATNKECKALLNWLKESNQNRLHFADLKKISIETKISREPGQKKATEAFTEFMRKVEVSESVDKLGNPAVNRLRVKKMMRFAALFLLLLSLSIAGYFVADGYFPTAKTSEIVVEAPYGGKSNITLPDGSKVWLNAGSKLIYNTDFNRKSRQVEIIGEAFFDVEKNKYPFIVKTSHFDIRVLGTEFNVKSYPDEDAIETTLVEGAITIESEGLSEDLKLKPREKLTYHKSTKREVVQTTSTQAYRVDTNRQIAGSQKKIDTGEAIEILENVPTEEEISWKDGDMIFNKEPLGELTRRLARKYDIEFVYANEDLQEYSYSGTLRDFPLEQVLRALELTSPLDYKIDGKTVTLFRSMN